MYVCKYIQINLFIYVCTVGIVRYQGIRLYSELLSHLSGSCSFIIIMFV